MKTMTKAQLAKKAGVRYSTFWRWMQNPEIQAKLAPFVLNKNQHILPPKAVKIICEHYAIEID